LIDASFCAHPSALKAPEMIVVAITKYKVPYSLAHAELDFNLTSMKVDEGEAILREKVGRGAGENGCWYEFRRRRRFRLWSGLRDGFESLMEGLWYAFHAEIDL